MLNTPTNPLDVKVDQALTKDGAIRRIDGRWSEGFVEDQALQDGIKSGALVIEIRKGMQFVVRAK